MNAERHQLAERVAALPPEQRAALRRRLAEGERGAAAPTPRFPPGSPAPLSSGQQRLWFIDTMARGQAAYNETVLLPLPHAVDPAALAWAVGELGRRHEVLRSRFLLDGDEPVQLPLPTLDIDLPVHDLRQLPAAERPAEATRLAAALGQRPFDLAAGPPLRAALLRLEPADHLLALIVHHIATDGWSTGIILVELLTLYWSRATGKPSPLPEPALQYGDFALWQRRSLAGAALAPQLEYWRGRLAGLHRVELPADRTRPSEPSLRGGRVPLHLAPELEEALAALARRENATITAVMLAGLFALAHRLTGEDDLAIGCPAAGRDRPGLAGLVGFFINTLVLRLDLGGDPPFAQLIRHVSEAMNAALARQDVPFERVVDALQPPRDASPVPFFQIMFQLFDATHFEGLPPELRRPVDGVDTGTSKFDLSVQFTRTSFGLRGFLEYNSDLFERGRVEAMARQLVRLLEHAAARPGQRVSGLELLAPGDERRILMEWNATDADYERDAALGRLVRRQAEARPYAVAVRCADQSLTYGALVGQARAVAAKLAAAGVEAGDVVGLHMRRALQLPVVMLGILEAGAAYLPLDADSPAERTCRLLADAGARLVVAADPDAPALAPFEGQAIAAAALADGAEAEEAGPAGAADRSADIPACLIYTSGTTGTPKGVVVSHRNIVRLVQDRAFVDWRPGAVCLHFSPLAFDASTLEIWGCLANGGTLAIHPPHLPALGDLAAFIRDEGVEIAFLTTALCRQMVDDHAPALRRLRVLLTGGEAMSAAMAAAAWRALPRTRVVNCYGPAECSVISTAWTIDGSEADGAPVPIGRPLANMRAYVLDRYGNPVPEGVPGELWIGGEGVASGYWRRDALTAERFLPDRFGGGAGARRYRTGDIAAWRSDGNLVFHGRRDRQVKLSGYRIEPGEVEAAASAHPAVSLAAVVMAARPVPHLALFAAARPGATVSKAELARFLGERLPRHMVPAAIDLRASLPLNGSGKVDFDALVRDAETAPAAAPAFELPRTPTERAVAGLWAELLERDRIGIDENFFDLGGHSLLAMRVLSRVRDALGVDISMAAFFEEPTVRALAGRAAPA